MTVASHRGLLGLFSLLLFAGSAFADDYSIVDTSTLIRVQDSQANAARSASYQSQSIDRNARQVVSQSVAEEAAVKPVAETSDAKSSTWVVGAFAAMILVGVGLASAGIFFSGSRAITRHRR